MIQGETLEEQIARLEEEEKTREFYWKDERAKEEHLRKLKKIEVSSVKATHRSKVLVDILKVITRLPAIIILSFFIPVLVLAGKEIPESIQRVFNDG